MNLATSRSGRWPCPAPRNFAKNPVQDVDRRPCPRLHRDELALRHHPAGACTAAAAAGVHLGAEAQCHDGDAAARADHDAAPDDDHAAHHDHDDDRADEHDRHDVPDVDPERYGADTPDHDHTCATRDSAAVVGSAATSATAADAGRASSARTEPRAVVRPHGYHGFPG